MFKEEFLEFLCQLHLAIGREQVWKKLFTGFLHLFTIVQINKYEKLK